MSYTNITGVPTSGSLSAPDLATLKAYVTAQQATGGSMVGYSDQQIADALNGVDASGKLALPTIPNPRPQTTLSLATLPKTAVLSALLSLKLQATAAGNTDAATALAGVESSVQGNPLDPIPAVDIEGIAALLAPSFTPITAAVTAALNPPSPNWPASIPTAPWAITELSVPTWLVAADIAAALAG